jgi:hypothetical protein
MILTFHELIQASLGMIDGDIPKETELAIDTFKFIEECLGLLMKKTNGFKAQFKPH